MSLAGIPPSLIVRCQKGDLDSFEMLFMRIREDLYRVIYSFMRDHDDTDEVMQESLIRIFRHLPALKDVEKFPSWTMRIVVNQCHTHRTRKGRHACVPLDDFLETDEHQATFQSGMSPSPRETLIRGEVMESILEAIGQLPRRQRSAILLFEIEGFSVKEVAETMQCSEGAVKFNIHQARKKLQKSLSAQWNSLRGSMASKPENKAAESDSTSS